MQRRRTYGTKNFIRLIPILYLIFFFLLPIILWISIYNDQFTLRSITAPQFFKQFWLTGLISFITAIASVLFTYPIALLWWNCRKNKWSSVIMYLVFIPIILGLLTRNYAWMNLLSYTSFEYSFNAVIVVMVYIFIPFTFFVLIQGFSNISENSLDAAKVMGANIVESFIKVIFPQTVRHIFIALFLVFANSLCYYITPAMIGGGNFDMIGNIIWKYVDKGLFSDASNIALTFICYAVPSFIIALYFIYRRRKIFLSR